ncbi:MAG: hypothetical protein FK730_12540, partial [Asgard group archaeon]|nr:hypothetical protein [Asgard group archaeon]
MPANGLPATVFISDGIMIITIILTIMMLFIGFEKTKIVRTTVIMGTLYLLVFTLAHALIPFFNTGNWAIPLFFGKNIVLFYSNYSISFINLLLLGIITIFVIVNSITQMNQEKITITEKITYIVMLCLILIFNISTLSALRVYLIGMLSASLYYGFFMLPYVLETILIAFAIILITMSIVSKENKVINILGLILVNIFFLGFISATVINTNMNLTIGGNYVPIALGNYLIILGTVLTC